VTGGGYCADMHRSSLERRGVLIVRAWLEGPDQRLVARITKTIDVESEPATVSVVGTAADVYSAVQAWLEELSSGDGGETAS
jgi:hypothetical protein